MSYKNLKNFQTILNRKDFNYISDHKKIKEVAEVILYRISNPDGREANHIKILKEFLENLTDFYNSIADHNIPDIKRGYLIVFEELQRCIKLFSEPEFKRKSISRGYCKKFNKAFLVGLNLIYLGLDDSFKLDGGISLDNGYFANYLINSTIGLGNAYLFNESVINEIKSNNFSKKALQQFLLNLKKNHKIRDAGNGWQKYGSGRGDDYRAYGTKKHLFHKSRIYILIPNSPAIKKRMDNYVRDNEPASAPFRKAA